MSTTDRKVRSGRPLMDRHQAAAYLGISERWLKRRLYEQEIPFVRMGKLLRFDPDDLDRYIDEQRGKPYPGRG